MPAVEAVIAVFEVLHAPRQALATFDVAIGGRSIKLVVSEQGHLDGIAAARSAHNAALSVSGQHDPTLHPDIIATDADYVQFILAKWAGQYKSLALAITEHNQSNHHDTVRSIDQILQVTLDRAVESYCRQFAISA